MKKIAIVSKNLNVGGIQRSLINLLINLDLSKYDVDCYLYEAVNFYNDLIPEKVNLFYIKARNPLIRFIPYRIVKKFSKCRLKNVKYDYVIDFDGYQTDTSLDTILSNSKNKVYWIHQNLLMKRNEEIKYRFLHFFMKSKYKYYDKFVGVSKGVIEPFERLNKIDISKNSIVIPNYIDTKSIFKKMAEICDLKVDNKKYNFVSVGRICNAKGYDILIDYFKKLTDYRKDFHFYLIGDGVDRDKIERLIEKLQMSEYVTLLGNQSNPFKFEKEMDGFVLTSRYEGQGMVLWEALAVGLELFIPKNLEIYNDGLVGYEDFLEALINAKKKPKKINDLKGYNNKITISISKLLK